MPGIGKTASFLEEIKKIEKEQKNNIIFIHINCLKLEKPEDCYEIILRNIFNMNSKLKNCRANYCLENVFKYK